METAADLIASTPAYRRDRPTQVRIISFGYDHGPAPEADIVVDVRDLLDPDNHPDHRHANGLDREVHNLVHGNQGAAALVNKLDDTAFAAAQSAVDRPVTIAIGSTLGRHRSVVIAEHVAKYLWLRLCSIEIEHRDIDKPHPGRSTVAAGQYVFGRLTGAARLAHLAAPDVDDYDEDDGDDWDDDFADVVDPIDVMARQRLDGIVSDWVFNGTLPASLARDLCEQAYWDGVPGVGALLGAHLTVPA